MISPTRLARALRHRPVAPSRLISVVRNHDAYVEFTRIARELFEPEDTQEIMTADPARWGGREHAQVARFCEKISERWFEIYECEEYAQVLCGVPYVKRGWMSDDYHEYNRDPGEMMLWALAEDPWGDPSIRVALLESCQVWLPRELLERIPVGGVPREQLHANLDGTAHEGAALYCDWLWADTGNRFLDISDEVGDYDTEWSREWLDAAKAEWDRMQEIDEKMVGVAEWLEVDPAPRFGALLEAALTPRDQLTLPLFGLAKEVIDAQRTVPLHAGEPER